ncbi:MAG: bifunctional metallophosphatase/5'-nucleotidase [Novosphingobium sp.]|nr:bifunctional metallophosphatase/5'-nucleotidase [Novosphingobium sp.]
MTFLHSWRRLAAAAAIATLASCAAPASHVAGASVAGEPVTVGIVAINDFHGALEPPKAFVPAPDGDGGTVPVPAGGAAWLASAIDAVRNRYPNHLTVSAGDLISASQLASSIYLDEPAIGVANRIGLDFNAVGNHEFDRGRDELLRMQRGGCAQHTSRKPCQIERFAGAKFRFLAASTLTENGGTLFPATALKSFGSGSRKVTIGLIGLTLRGTPQLVSPDGIRGLRFADETDTINALVPKLRAKGADAVVVLIHQGGAQNGGNDPNACVNLTGEIRPILDRLRPGVDVVVSGHTHKAYVCDYGTINPAEPILLTSAGVYGELVTDIRLEIDPATHRVVARQAHNVIVQSVPFTSARGPIATTTAYPQFQPRPDIAAYVRTYTDAAARFARRKVGTLAGPASKGVDGESNRGGPLGNLVADAQLAATRSAGAQIALTNPFGIRAPLVPAADGTLTFGDIFAVQPFTNALVTETLSGAALKAVLEQGLDGHAARQLLAPSAGFVYRFDGARPAGQRIVGMSLDGKPIDPAARYRVTVNSFLASGGDGFTGFTHGHDAAIAALDDLGALEAWLNAAPPRIVPQEERVVEVRPTA